MAQPTAYTRAFNFSNQQAATPNDPISGPYLDAELNRVKLTTDQIRTNLALIQADDGTVKDGVVDYDSLTAQVKGLLGTTPEDLDAVAVGVTAPVAAALGWATRAAFVTSVASSEFDFEDGTVVSAAGFQYVRDSTSTAISDLPGWKPNGPFVSIRHFGATIGSDARTAMLAAIAYAKRIYIPAGAWTWTGTISSSWASDVVWVIDSQATFPSVPVSSPQSIPDLSSLGGRIEWQMEGYQGLGWRFGGGGVWPEERRPAVMALAEVCVVSPNGGYALLGASRNSDNPDVGQSTVAVGGVTYNDDEVNVDPGWCFYGDGTRAANAGAMLVCEFDVVNIGATAAFQPYTSRSLSSKDSFAMVLASGAENPSATPASAAMAVWANGSTFERGFVFKNGSLYDGPVKEFMTTYKDTKLAWYDASAIVQSYIKDDAAYFTVKSDTAASGHETIYARKRADGTTATGANDEIHVDRGYGWDGAAVYGLTYIQHYQRTNFSGSNARGSVDIGAKNSTGTYREVSLQATANDTFGPTADNVINLGGASYRFKELFCANGTINTSDREMKTGIRPLDAAEKRAAQACAGLFRAYRWADAFAEKGEGARIHFGVIAQDVESVFVAEGLDPWAYGVLCRDEIEEFIERPIRIRVQKKTMEIYEDKVVEVVDGRAVESVRQLEREHAHVERMPVFDTEGNPVLEEIVEREIVEKLVDGKRKMVVTRKVVGHRQAEHIVPVMEEIDSVERELVKTGRFRMGVRYNELFAFVLAGMA